MTVLARNNAFDLGFPGLLLSRVAAFCSAALDVFHEALEMRREALKKHGSFEG